MKVLSLSLAPLCGAPRLSDYGRFRSDVNVVEEPDGQGSRQ